jgi:zinc resistance-associated protein
MTSFSRLSLASAALLLGLLPAVAQQAAPTAAPSTTITTPAPDASGHMGGAMGMKHKRAPLSAEDQSALTDARIAGMLAALKLNADQQKLWPPVEKSIREMAADQADRRGKGQDRNLDFIARLDQMSERATKQAERVKGLSMAVKPLWATLDERQKRLMPMLMRPTGGRGGYGGGRGGHMGGDGPMGGAPKP